MAQSATKVNILENISISLFVLVKAYNACEMCLKQKLSNTAGRAGMFGAVGKTAAFRPQGPQFYTALPRYEYLCVLLFA